VARQREWSGGGVRPEARRRQELFELLRIPSISTDPEHADDVRAAAEWLTGRLARAGLTASLEETGGHPVVIAEHVSGMGGVPALLVYGHYDVQPPDPLDAWTSPPFEPVLREGRIVGRGAADDKSQVLIQLWAAEAALAAGRLPVDLTLVFEGEEEIGSPHLAPFLQTRRPALRADHVLIADSMMFAPGRPSLIFGTRGMAYFEVEARTAAHDLHSGQFGGAVPNPAHALAALIASLHDDTGRVAVEGFYDDVVAPPPSLLAEWRALGFDEDAFRRAAGGAILAGEAGYTTLERLWVRPALDVNGILSGYTGAGKKTVLPATALAKLSCRLVPAQDPERIAVALRDHVERFAPPGVGLSVRLLQANRPWREQPRALLFEAAGRALESAFGVPPVRVAHGGTLPIAGEFRRLFDAPVAVMGFALPGANMHGPDEWFPVEHLRKGVQTMVELYGELAG
jgi:acetylornithine deacetylase/succinyl-diaminopimelate desuccinylase-like protein